MRYLLDSDWTIQCLNGVDRFVERIDELASAGLGLSVVSLAEVYEGVLGSAEPILRERELNTWLRQVRLLEVDAEVARVFARERVRLRREGRLIADLDLLIGATALRHDLTLLSNNRRHFERIPRLSIESI